MEFTCTMLYCVLILLSMYVHWYVFVCTYVLHAALHAILLVVRNFPYQFHLPPLAPTTWKEFGTQNSTEFFHSAYRRIQTLACMEHNSCGAKWPQPDGRYAPHNFLKDEDSYPAMLAISSKQIQMQNKELYLWMWNCFFLLWLQSSLSSPLSSVTWSEWKNPYWKSFSLANWWCTPNFLLPQLSIICPRKKLTHPSCKRMIFLTVFFVLLIEKHLHSFHIGKQSVEAILLVEAIFLVETTSKMFHHHHLLNKLQCSDFNWGRRAWNLRGPSWGVSYPQTSPLSTLMVPEKNGRYKFQTLVFLDRFVFWE